MTARICAFALAVLLPVSGLAQTAEPGPSATLLAEAIAAEGCLLNSDSTDAIQARLEGKMTDEDVMAGTVELITGGYLIQEGAEAFRLKGLGC